MNSIIKKRGIENTLGLLINHDPICECVSCNHIRWIQKDIEHTIEKATDNFLVEHYTKKYKLTR